MYKLLIADDDSTSLSLLSALNWADFGITVAKSVNNGAEVLNYVKENEVDIILTDIKMPFMDGIELTEKLEQMAPHIIVVVLSGYDDYTYVRHCMKKSNVYDYLLKPIDPDEWRVTFQNIVKMLGGNEFSLDMTKVSKSKKHIVDNAVDYIQKHYAEPLTLSQVADSVYINHTYLSRVIKGELGMGFSDLLNLIRIENAKKFLKDPSYNINRIAEMVGYSSPQYFNHSFKKIVGITPWQYRSK